MSKHILDAKNSLCPMPVIKTQDTVNTLGDGEILEVHCTDPGALSDIPAWCRINGHTIVSAEENNELVTIIIQVNKN